MVSLGYNYVLLLLSLLITTQIGVTLSSCELDTVGTCGCCKNFTTECVIIPSNIIPSFESYEKYICVPKLSTPNFSLNHCNCTLKEPTFCICPNQYPNIYPVYSTCYSFTECIINDIKVNAQQKIRERVCKKAIRYTGRCSENYVSRFYYDSNTNSCQEFIYSGCSINRFTFTRQDFCEEVCRL